MAKGFTVKANAPKTKKVEDDFNLEEAKALAKGKAIVFCLPGRGVSYIFLKNFVQTSFRMDLQFRSVKTTHLWLTLHVASA